MGTRSRIFCGVALFCFFGGLVWGGWYVYDKGFGRSWREYVSSEFRKRGVEVYLRRLTLDPFHGIVAKDVRIVDEQDHDTVLAVISQVVLDINYGNLLHGEPFLDAIELRDARVALPLNRAVKGSLPIELTGLNSRVVFPPHQVYVNHAEANFYGVHVSAAGRFINPEGLKIDTPDDARRRGEVLGKLITTLQRLRFKGTAPRLHLTFRGDLSIRDTISVDATLSGEKIECENYQLDRLFIAASYAENVLSIRECTLTDLHGDLHAAGTYGSKTGEVQMQLRSELDLQGLLRPFRLASPLDEVTFYDMPTVDFLLEANVAETPRFQLIGRVTAERFSVRSIIFQSFAADISWDGSNCYIRDAHLVHRSGEVQAEAMHRPGDVRLALTSTINPEVFAPLLSGKASAFMAEWDFTRSPEIRVSAHGPSPDFRQCSATGHISMGPARFRGVPFNTAFADFELKDGAVTYKNFEVRREEGSGTGTLTYDFEGHEVRIEKVHTTLNVAEVALWIDPDLVRDLAPYRFRERPSLRLDGVVQFAGGKNTDLHITLEAPAGLEYTFLKKNLSFPKAAAKLWFTDRRLRISEATASLYSGEVWGAADISLAREAQNYDASIHLDGVDFASLTRLYFNYDNSEGLLNGSYAFTGVGDDAHTMRGRGSVTIVNGNVFAIPILGPFSGILNGIVPGMGYNHARKASSTFTIEDGVIRTNSFVVEGRGFSMIGGGELRFLDDSMDFGIRINAQGLPGVLLFPVSKLFEYVADGSLSKPQWRPKRLPKF